MQMKDNAWDLFDKWANIYNKENDKLGGNSQNNEFVEGWSIIEDTDHVKTLDDAVGLLIFGYDDNALSIVDEWIETDENGEDADYLGFRLGDIKNKLENYYE